MHGKTEGVAHPGNSSKHIRSRPEVRDFSKILDGMALFLQGVGVYRTLTDQGNVGTCHFHILVSTGTLDDRASANDRTAGSDRSNEALVRKHILVDDHLQSLQTRSVIHLKKADILALTLGTDPAFCADDLVGALSFE
ncbi:hypothetical protein SDC9_88824 [bioreactor metagenome]|uniref:Uncharacterized protein n=1 Tax=bioreactor metagenome TaxID=1076179 RepID=A0A644ZMV4_9ZZZZ